MAQDQKIEFLFAAQVSGNEELKKLTNSVDKLRKEMDAIKAANGGLVTGMGNFSRSIGNASSHVQAYQKHLDAQAKAMRNHRQGTQQLGMQFNDLGTSISTGASPIQAFNQQLGQMGYALSMMEGKAGSVGAFLAGPWGAAIVLATMAAGYFVESLLKTEDGADKAKKATIDLANSFDFASASADQLRKFNEALSESNKGVAATAIEAANATAKQAAAEANKAQQELNSAKALLVKEQAYLSTLRSQVGRTGIGKETEGGTFAVSQQQKNINTQITTNNELQKSLDGLQLRSRKFTAESYSLSAAMDNNAKITERYDQRINDLQNKYTAGKISREQFTKGIDAENAAYKRLQNTVSATNRSSNVGRGTGLSSGKSDFEKQQEKDAKSLESFFNLIERGSTQELPEYARKVMAIEEAYSKLNATQQATNKVKFTKIFEQLRLDDTGAQDEVSKYLQKPLGELPISKEMTDIISRTEELNDSFEEIGMTVSDAFKGMLTGASSWKDGMRSLIGSVIDQLWKLFVVQKIVGIVSGALGGATGTPVKGFTQTTAVKPPSFFAKGTTYAPGGMAVVGEQGPELINLPKGSQVIPNHKMGGMGGSFNISVDARGSNDPAAVRAQVQQGILEAAPAIIAAAESRTIAGLRRPRLGGVMQ